MWCLCRQVRSSSSADVAADLRHTGFRRGLGDEVVDGRPSRGLAALVDE